jgi:hypothetical protein
LQKKTMQAHHGELGKYEKMQEKIKHALWPHHLMITTASNLLAFLSVLCHCMELYN